MKLISEKKLNEFINQPEPTREYTTAEITKLGLILDKDFKTLDPLKLMRMLRVGIIPNHHTKGQYKDKQRMVMGMDIIIHNQEKYKHLQNVSK